MTACRQPFGNGKAAMELSGQWAPSVESANAADKKGVANLGFFNFPLIEGGVGVSQPMLWDGWRWLCELARMPPPEAG